MDEKEDFISDYYQPFCSECKRVIEQIGLEICEICGSKLKQIPMVNIEQLLEKNVEQAVEELRQKEKEIDGYKKRLEELDRSEDREKLKLFKEMICSECKRVIEQIGLEERIRK